MKLNLKSIFEIKLKGSNQGDKGTEFNYDEHVGFYYSNLINSLILFSFTKQELEKLTSRTFNPLFELESEIDYAFTPILFDTVFRNNAIDNALKSELLAFKEMTDNIPSDIWDWEYLDKHETWIEVKQQATVLLNKLGIKNRIYNEDYTIVYDKDGNLLKKGKKTSS